MNQVKDGVIRKLKTLYPDEKVSDEKIRQGLENVRFFVKVLDTAQNREIDRRYKRCVFLDIHYFASNYEEAYEVAETLYEGMEYIQVGEHTVRGTGMRSEIVDDVLHFFVSYDYHVIKPKAPGTKLQGLEQEGHIIE